MRELFSDSTEDDFVVSSAVFQDKPAKKKRLPPTRKRALAAEDAEIESDLR